LSLITYQKYGF